LGLHANGTDTEHPRAALPNGWIGTPFRFANQWHHNAAEAAIYGLQAILTILPDAASNCDWNGFPWQRTKEILVANFAVDLDCLRSQVSELVARVENERDAYITAEKEQRKTADPAKERKSDITKGSIVRVLVPYVNGHADAPQKELVAQVVQAKICGTERARKLINELAKEGRVEKSWGGKSLDILKRIRLVNGRA
jgi:hypothetical protein